MTNLVIPSQNIFMARYQCFSCNKNLDGFPKIKVEGNINCYSCAKKVVATLDYHTELKHANEVKAHDCEYQKWKKWNARRESAKPSVNIQAFITIGLAIVCAVLMTSPIFFFLPGLVVGVVVNQIYFNSQKNDWLRRNPEPALTAYPSNNFVRDRIELIGGKSGSPLSSGYRESILKRDGYLCHNCGVQFQTDQLEVHHIIPQAKGGKHYPTNLITLCWRCHKEEIWFGHKHKMR
jgi:DNA-directed RNA polymerase subunit RPC12/RpoP